MPLPLSVLSPLPQVRALLLLQPLLLLMPMFLLLLPPTGMIHGLGLLLHLLLTCGHPGGPHLQRGPGLRARASHPVRGPKIPIPHLFRDRLMNSPQIYLLLRLSGVPSSIATLLQAIQIVVTRKCTAKHIMIFQLLLPIPSLEIP